MRGIPRSPGAYRTQPLPPSEPAARPGHEPCAPARRAESGRSARASRPAPTHSAWWSTDPQPHAPPAHGPHVRSPSPLVCAVDMPFVNEATRPPPHPTTPPACSHRITGGYALSAYARWFLGCNPQGSAPADRPTPPWGIAAKSRPGGRRPHIQRVLAGMGDAAVLGEGEDGGKRGLLHRAAIICAVRPPTAAPLPPLRPGRPRTAAGPRGWPASPRQRRREAPRPRRLPQPAPLQEVYARMCNKSSTANKTGQLRIACRTACPTIVLTAAWRANARATATVGRGAAQIHAQGRALALGVDAYGDHQGHADDTSPLPHLRERRIKRQVRVGLGQGRRPTAPHPHTPSRTEGSSL